MDQKNEDSCELVPIEKAIAQQLKNLQTLYNTNVKFENFPSEQEANLLSHICNQAHLIKYNPASGNQKITEEIYTCILHILNGTNISFNKAELIRLKTDDRENMPYTKTHRAGIVTVFIGFGLLIAAAVVFGLIGLPASLIIFLPLLIIGVIGLATGGGLIKKGMLDNDKLHTSAWEDGHIDQFITCLTHEVKIALQNANTQYLPSRIDDPPSNYTTIYHQSRASATRQAYPTLAGSSLLPNPTPSE